MNVLHYHTIECYPSIHLFKNFYLVRHYTYEARKLSLWGIARVIGEKQ